MITSFEVGSIFKIIDQGSPALKTLFKGVTDLDAAVTTTRKNLTGLARTKLIGVGNQFKAITTEVAGLDKALGGVAGGIGKITKASAALTGTTSAIAGASSAVQVLADEWGKVATSAGAAATAMRAAVRVRVPSIGAGAGGGALPGAAGALGGRHGPRQGWHLGRFGVGVPVAGGHVHASTLSSAPLVAAGAGLFGIYEMMKQTEEPLHQEALLRVLGVDRDDPSMIGKMSQEARDIAIAVPGSGYSKNMKSMGELYSIVGAKDALKMAPLLAEVDRVISIVGGGKQGETASYTLARASDLLGKLTNPVTGDVDTDVFGKILGNMSKISIASHGKISPEQWLNFAQQAGPAAGNLDEQGIYTSAAIMQAMKGFRAGTAAQAIQRQFSGGIMTQSKARELVALGIAADGDYTVEKGGHVMWDVEEGREDAILRDRTATRPVRCRDQHAGAGVDRSRLCVGRRSG
jgi:hypothetical protein